MKKLFTIILAVCMLMSFVACGAKEEVLNESGATDEQQQSTGNAEEFLGVFRGDDFTIVFAQDVEPTEYFDGDVNIAIDMGFDIFFPRTPKVVSDAEITDFTGSSDDVVAEFDFKLDGDTLYYHRLIHEDNYEDNITLQRTDEDASEVYNELLQKSSEKVSQNPETDVTDEIKE